MKSYLICFFMLISHYTFTDELISASSQSDQQEYACSLKIVEEQPDSIEGFDNDKLLLKPERIFSTSNGLVLYNGYSLIPLPMVRSTDSGCFILCAAPVDNYRAIYKCQNKNCGRTYFHIMGRGKIKCKVCGADAIEQ